MDQVGPLVSDNDERKHRLRMAFGRGQAWPQNKPGNRNPLFTPNNPERMSKQNIPGKHVNDTRKRPKQDQGIMPTPFAFHARMSKVIGNTAYDYIDDFVHSGNKRFKGKSKQERIRMALGAYYGNR